MGPTAVIEDEVRIKLEHGSSHFSPKWLRKLSVKISTTPWNKRTQLATVTLYHLIGVPSWKDFPEH